MWFLSPFLRVARGRRQEEGGEGGGQEGCRGRQAAQAQGDVIDSS